MKPENEARVVPIAGLIIVLVVAVAGIFYFWSLPGVPTSLPIPAGTVIRPPYAVVRFTVEGGSANLVGAWHMDAGGYIWVIEAHRTNGPFDPVCGPPLPPWNGTLFEALLPGTYLVVLAPNPHGTIVVTQAVALAHPGANWSTEESLISTGCVPAGWEPPPFAPLSGAT